MSDATTSTTANSAGSMPALAGRISLSALNRQAMSLLLVEDDPADARLLTEFLKRSRYFDFAIAFATSKAQALEIGCDKSFGLVILDYWLRTEASLPLHQSWSQSFPGVPILLVSSVDVADIQALALSCGANGYLHKNDLSPSALDAVIRTMLHTRLSEQRLRDSVMEQQRDQGKLRDSPQRRSHEVLSTLNAMHGFAQLLSTDSRDVLPGVDTAGYIDLIKQGSETLIDILRADLARAQTRDGPAKLSFHQEDIGKIIKSVALTAQHLCHDKGHSLLVSTVGGPVQAEVDKTAIYQLLLNLVTNAVKYSPRETTITLVLTDMGDRLKISVSDQGIGMSKSEVATALLRHARIVTPAEMTAPGHGLGLAMVTSIVEMHCGEMEIDSLKGWGTTVHIVLPVKRARLN